MRTATKNSINTNNVLQKWLSNNTVLFFLTFSLEAPRPRMLGILLVLNTQLLGYKFSTYRYDCMEGY